MFHKFLIGVNIFVFTRSGHFIVGKRKGSYDRGKYGLPGGHLELGESFHDCAARELLEETGIEVESTRFHVLTATNDLDDPDGLHYVTIFVGCSLVTDTDTEYTETVQPKVALSTCIACSSKPRTLTCPQNLEPEKCEGWEWWTWDDLRNATNSKQTDQRGGNIIEPQSEELLLAEPLRNLVKQHPKFGLHFREKSSLMNARDKNVEKS